jgi:hypothetical protein
MREGLSGTSSAIATRGSDFGAVSLGKRESCRMAAKHFSDRSRPASSVRMCVRMFDASDPRLYRARKLHRSDTLGREEDLMAAKKGSKKGAKKGAKRSTKRKKSRKK